MYEDKFVVHMPSLMKTSRQGNHVQDLVFNSFPRHEICIVDLLKCYLAMSKERRGEDETRLIISPWTGKGVTSSTIGRWMKSFLNQAGIFNYGAHSIRGASSSKAHLLKIPTDVIMKRACWKNATTFAKHYCRDVIPYDTALLSGI